MRNNCNRKFAVSDYFYLRDILDTHTHSFQITSPNILYVKIIYPVVQRENSRTLVNHRTQKSKSRLKKRKSRWIRRLWGKNEGKYLFISAWISSSS